MKSKRLNHADSRRNYLQKRDRMGALAVEVAICLPLLFMLLFACYEIAHANMLMHATESAAYEAARIGIVPGAKTDKIEESARFILSSVGVNNFTIKMTPSTISTKTPKVKIEIDVPFAKNTLIPQFFLKNPVFHGECTLTREVF